MSDNKTGLEALLRPEDSILALIDHQPCPFALAWERQLLASTAQQAQK